MLANHILEILPEDVIVHYDNSAGMSGPDVVSISPSGEVRIFDSKYRSREQAVTPSMRGLKGCVDLYGSSLEHSINRAVQEGRLTPDRLLPALGYVHRDA